MASTPKHDRRYAEMVGSVNDEMRIVYIRKDDIVREAMKLLAPRLENLITQEWSDASSS